MTFYMHFDRTRGRRYKGRLFIEIPVQDGMRVTGSKRGVPIDQARFNSKREGTQLDGQLCSFLGLGRRNEASQPIRLHVA